MDANAATSTMLAKFDSSDSLVYSFSYNMASPLHGFDVFPDESSFFLYKTDSSNLKMYAF